MRKLTALLLAFILGATTAVITAPKQTQAQQPQMQYKTYRIDFNNNRQCEFCCCKPAEYYEFSAQKSDGSVTRQYLCQECREFLRYK